MDLPGYQRRQFRHSFFPKTETVGPSAIVWALVSGPFYYWKRGARIEAILLLLVSLLPMFYNPNDALISYAALWDATTLIWLVSGVCAPPLLAWSFRRRGWHELDDSAMAPNGGSDEAPPSLLAGRASAKRRQML